MCSTTSQILLPRSRWVEPCTAAAWLNSVGAGRSKTFGSAITRQLRLALREKIAQDLDLRELLRPYLQVFGFQPWMLLARVLLQKLGNPRRFISRDAAASTFHTRTASRQSSPEAQIPQVPVPIESFACQVTRKTNVPSRPHSTITHRSSDASETASDPKQQRPHDLCKHEPSAASFISRALIATQPFDMMILWSKGCKGAAREMIDYVHASRRSGAEPQRRSSSLRCHDKHFKMWNPPNSSL